MKKNMKMGDFGSKVDLKPSFNEENGRENYGSFVGEENYIFFSL